MKGVEKIEGMEYLYAGHGMFRVNDIKKGRMNFVRPDGTLLLDRWVPHATMFHNGLSKVSRLGNANFVRPDGTWLSEEGWYSATRFHKGLAVVMRESDCLVNHIRPDGSLLSSEWWVSTTSFLGGYADVYTADGVHKLIDTEGRVKDYNEK